MGIFIYAYLPKGAERFAQASCKGRSVMETFFLVLPFVYIAAFAAVGVVFPAIVFALPLVIMIIAWTIAILLRKKEIWPPGEPYRPRFVKVWSVSPDGVVGR